MAKQSNGQSNVVSSSDVQDMFAQFLADQGMSISDKGVVTSEAKEETVSDEVNEFFDKVIENVQKEINMVNEEDEVKPYRIMKGKNGPKIGVFSKALKSNAPVIKYELWHGITNGQLKSALKKVGFKFEYKGHHSNGNPMREVTHDDGPTRMATMGRKTNGIKGIHEFNLS